MDTGFTRGTEAKILHHLGPAHSMCLRNTWRLRREGRIWNRGVRLCVLTASPGAQQPAHSFCTHWALTDAGRPWQRGLSLLTAC